MGVEWGLRDGRGLTLFRYPVHTAHISITDPELRGELETSSMSETHENGWNCFVLVLHLLICLLVSFRALYTAVAPSRHLVNVDELFSKSGVNLDISHITVT